MLLYRHVHAPCSNGRGWLHGRGCCRCMMAVALMLCLIQQLHYVTSAAKHQHTCVPGQPDSLCIQATLDGLGWGQQRCQRPATAAAGHTTTKHMPALSATAGTVGQPVLLTAKYQQCSPKHAPKGAKTAAASWASCCCSNLLSLSCLPAVAALLLAAAAALLPPCCTLHQCLSQASSRVTSVLKPTQPSYLPAHTHLLVWRSARAAVRLVQMHHTAVVICRDPN